MASKKKAEPAAAPKQTQAATDKDKEEKPAVYRVDLGESLPPQPPPPTGTDKHK